MRGRRITEAEFMAQVLDFARVHGWRRAHFRPGRTSRGWRTAVQGDGTGFPDLLLLRADRLVVAELKRDGRKPDPEQVAWLEAFRQVPGVEVFLWRPADWPEIEATLARDRS